MTGWPQAQGALRRLARAMAAAALLLAGDGAQARGGSHRPIPIKVVVVAMFEIGKDTGDQPGEFQAWVERLPLPRVLPFPQGYHHLRYDADKAVLAVLTGVGTARSTAAIINVWANDWVRY